MEFLAPGTPEQVWQAMATGPGNAAWFTRATIDERTGGAIRFEFGPDASSSGTVTVWEPPYRFAYVEDEWSPGAPPIATEITITSRSGGQCVVRMVHSLYATSDDWDDQMESFEGGWPGFFAVLRLYLSHFAGQRGASFSAMTKVEDDHLAVWKRLTAELDLGGADVGEARVTPTSPEPLSGVIERVQQDGSLRTILLRTMTPSPGVMLLGTYGAAGTISASLSRFVYGDDAEQLAAASAPAWRDWLAAFAARRDCELPVVAGRRRRVNARDRNR
jgi:uncharacterized protein YndB with AHSA1/START domain